MNCSTVHKRLRFVGICLFLSFLPACSLLGLGGAEVEAWTSSEDIVISNETNSTIYYVVEPRGPFEILWFPGIGDDISIAPGRTKEVKYDVLPMIEDAHGIVVHWWYPERRGDRIVPGKIHSISLKL